jgi:hypothetical protein
LHPDNNHHIHHRALNSDPAATNEAPSLANILLAVAAEFVTRMKPSCPMNVEARLHHGPVGRDWDSD